MKLPFAFVAVVGLFAQTPQAKVRIEVSAEHSPVVAATVPMASPPQLFLWVH